MILQAGADSVAEPPATKHVQTFQVSRNFFVLGSIALMKAIQREERFVGIADAIAMGLVEVAALSAEDLAIFATPFSPRDFIGDRKFHLSLPSSCTRAITSIQASMLAIRPRKLSRLEVVLLSLLKVAE